MQIRRPDAYFPLKIYTLATPQQKVNACIYISNPF